MRESFLYRIGKHVILGVWMEITFASAKLQRLCEHASLMRRELGDAGSRKLRSRLADLAAAASVIELSAGRPHQLKGNRAGQFALDLHGGSRLVFEPANEPLPLSADGSISWQHVTKVRIIFIGDYHD